MAVGTKAEARIRVACNDVAAIKLALDAGAKEVMVPMVTTKAETEQAVAASKYPPEGIRGWGPEALVGSQLATRPTNFEKASGATSKTTPLRLRKIATGPALEGTASTRQ
jgi:2-keto-3-deoxy-L-rhamnonate aldolase RhmA